MMIKLTKEEVERACELWIEGSRSNYAAHSQTSPEYRMAVHLNMEIKCKFVRGGVECIVTEKPKIEKVKSQPKEATK